MTAFLHDLLSDCMDLSDAQADRLVEVLLKVHLVTPDALARFELQAKIYHLRGRGMRPCELGQRFGLSRTQIFEKIRAHGKIRREVLKMAG
jgi:hypothetical protein